MSLSENLNYLLRRIPPVKMVYRIYKNIGDRFLKVFVYRYMKIDSLNIGGGPSFNAFRWLNLEEITSNINPNPFKLTPDCRFPVKRSSMKMVYTSHCLEHLDTKTVHRILEEVFRVLKEKGNFIIKLPDFDLILDSWRCNDVNFFSDDMWGFRSVTYTWKARNITDCLDYRAAMLFCGFWNEEYGDHYSGKFRQNKSAYHGPAVVGIELLQKLMKNHTPSQISAELRKIVLKNEKNFKFNHQNAWSRQELESLLAQTGFRIKSFDKEFIIANCKYIRGIDAMKAQSIYCWADKAPV